MLKVYAERFVEATQFLMATQSLLRHFEQERAKDGRTTFSPTERKVSQLDPQLAKLRQACAPLGMAMTVKQIDRMMMSKDRPCTFEELKRGVSEVFSRFSDELEGRSMYALRPGYIEDFEHPTTGWELIIERFECDFDVEEARKCLALERYTASVFHMMRVLERGVLELEMFLPEPDHKAHFGSVLQKLEKMTQHEKYEHVPDHLKGHLGFLRDVLSQLHAVKDSWRNKVSHVSILVPTGTFTEEIALGVHDATRLLMTKLRDGLPAKT